eukprot:3343855-Prymnesium_polylepis.1
MSRQPIARSKPEKAKPQMKPRLIPTLVAISDHVTSRPRWAGGAISAMYTAAQRVAGCDRAPGCQAAAGLAKRRGVGQAARVWSRDGAARPERAHASIRGASASARVPQGSSGSEDYDRRRARSRRPARRGSDRPSARRMTARPTSRARPPRSRTPRRQTPCGGRSDR